MPGISGYPATPGVAKSHTLQRAVVSVWSGVVLGLKSRSAQACKKEQGLKPADCSTQIPWEWVTRSTSTRELMSLEPLYQYYLASTRPVFLDIFHATQDCDAW